MSYRVLISPRARKKLAALGLPDPVLVEVYLRLREDLPQDPSRLLRRENLPLDGMVFPFSVVDPDNRFCEHFFRFLVVFGQDEESLIVENAAYVRHVDF